MSKVISVGNITMGGTGKTPIVMMLTEHYLNKGYSVCVLSRGYKGKIGYQMNVISDGKEIFFQPPIAADEPYIIAKNNPKAIVITGKNRLESYNWAVAKHQPEIFLLDDGFQYKGLKKDLDIVLIDYNRPTPWYYLRERPKALLRADIIVFTNLSDSVEFQMPQHLEKYIKNKQIYLSKVHVEGVYNYKNKKVDLEEEGLKSQEIVAFAGIAQNRLFFNTLESLRFNISKKYSFPDHHIYRKKDLQKLGFGARVFLTTEKDYFKIPEDIRRTKVYYLKISQTLNKLNNHNSQEKNSTVAIMNEIEYLLKSKIK